MHSHSLTLPFSLPLHLPAQHRTSSLDYNILGTLPIYPTKTPAEAALSAVAGELVLITEDGSETRLATPGDTVIQRGTLHAWRNPSATHWTRWITVLMAAAPAVVAGAALAPVFIDPATVPAGDASANSDAHLRDARSGEHAQTPSEVGA